MQNVTLTEWIAIALMGLVALLTRVAGIGMARWIPHTPFWQRFMNHLPGTILVAIVAPAFATGDPALTIAAAASLLVAILGLHLVGCMVVGIGTVALLRLVLA